MTTAVAGHREATDRILRIFAVFTSAGYLFYLLLLAPSIVTQADHFDMWWTPTAVVAVFGSGLVLGVSSLLRDTRAVGIAGAAAAVAFLVAIPTGLLAWNGPPLTNGLGVWLSTFPGLASLAAVAAWRPILVFVHMVVACTGVQIFNHVVRDPDVTNPLVPDIAFSIMFCTLFVGAAVMALRTGRVLDSTLEATHSAAAAAAASHARNVEHARFDALIHDGVMSTLLAAARQGATPRLSAQASATLRQLDALRAGPGPNHRFEATEIVAHLRAAAGDIDDAVTLDVREASGADALTMPVDAVRAVGAALAESLRNSIQHAGPHATRAVTVRVAPKALVVEVADTGRGFDPRMVPTHRLGLTVSIVGRMNRLPGGSGRVDSAPGKGTHVNLTWAMP
ncbi:sensor histidine kinase [Rhodococcus sp. NPDC003318]|uniref:sensor histidine kinase n=1 Tax=Rhodococcus sp. NPDC003318 TaxID=3364503 RepID=UPI0036CC1F93